MNLEFSQLAEAYRKLAEEAQGYNQAYWVSSGNSLDQLNAMLGVIALRLQRLENKE